MVGMGSPMPLLCPVRPLRWSPGFSRSSLRREDRLKPGLQRSGRTGHKRGIGLPMPTIPDLLAQAGAAWRAGQLGAAEHAYQQALQLDPTHADALANLGVLALK